MWIRQPDSSLGSVHELVTLASEWAKVSQRPRSGHQIASIDRADWRHRTNADRWNVAPDRIGVTGSSAGGHLSLILATTGGPEADDPIDRASSAVQAVGVFYPPTDYLNWAEQGDDAVGIGKQARWQPGFGDESKTAGGRQILGRAMSSIYHLSEQTPQYRSSMATPTRSYPCSSRTASGRSPSRREFQLSW